MTSSSADVNKFCFMRINYRNSVTMVRLTNDERGLIYNLHACGETLGFRKNYEIFFPINDRM